MADKCTTNAAVSFETSRQQFQFSLLGTDFNEAWRKERNNFNRRNEGGNEHPNLFAGRLGATADFNYAELNRLKAKVNRRSALYSRFTDADYDSDLSIENHESLWGIGPSRFEPSDARRSRSQPTSPRSYSSSRGRGFSNLQRSGRPVSGPPAARCERRAAAPAGTRRIASEADRQGSRAGQVVNGLGRDGRTMLCLNCNSKYYLIAVCPTHTPRQRSFFVEAMAHAETTLFNIQDEENPPPVDEGEREEQVAYGEIEAEE